MQKLILVHVALTGVFGCTNGGRCDEDNPCNDEDVCVAGSCEAASAEGDDDGAEGEGESGGGCELEADGVTASTCVYEMSECIGTLLGETLNGTCSRTCSRADLSSDDFANGDCPVGFQCDDGGLANGVFRCFNFNDVAANASCAGDLDCEGVIVEVQR